MIKHSFKRSEIFHEYVYCTHNEPIYYNSGRTGNNITAIGKYLFLGDKKHLTIDKIEEFTPHNCVAIIDRENKEIIINRSWKDYFDLVYDIPKDYEIFYKAGNLSSFDINDIEIKLENHLACLIEDYYKRELLNEFLVLKGNKLLYHSNTDNIYLYEHNSIKTYYGRIYDFIEKHGIKCYDFYNKNIIKNVTFDKYCGWTKTGRFTVECKTPKEIIEKKIFTREELDILTKRSFYTNYCYGEDISLSDVNKYWNAKFDKELHTKKHFPFSDVIQDDITTWRDYIIRRKSAIRLWERNHINNLREQIANSRKEGIIKALFNENCKSIGEYFRRTGLNYLVVNCKRLVNKRNKNELESVKSTLYFYGREQLRLSKDRKYIETSRDCAVRLSDAISLFRLVKFVYEKNKGTETSIDYSNKHIMCGKYQLLNIKFTKKNNSDFNVDNSIKCLITIGCHTLWYNDVIEFIKYYKLEKDFGIL